MTLRIVVLASGGGRSLQNLIDRSRDGRLDVEVALVGSNRANSGALVRAAEAAISHFHQSKGKLSHAEFSEAIFERIREQEPDYVCLAGFLKLLLVPDDYRGRVLNIHPSLIPAFCGRGYYGMKVHEAVFESGVRVTGCTVHFCDDEYDRGPILVQRAVTLRNETPAEIAVRVFEAECEAYPEALALLASGRAVLRGGRVEFKA